MGGRAPFNNAYGFAAGRGLTDRNGGAFDFDSMADHLRQNPDASLCMESEFPNRSDGLVLFEEFTGYSVPDSRRQILDTGIIYTETGAGNCDFGEVFTTDGRIPELDLTVVEDDGAMIIYNISVNLRQEVYGQAPQAFEALAEAVLSPLDRETMSALNQRVSSGGEEPEDVAREYLIDQGLLAG